MERSINKKMKIEKDISNLEPQMLKDKEYLWNCPEPGLKEIKTSAYILNRLKEMGYEDIDTNIFETGIIATLKGENPEKNNTCILFRSDIDAVVMDSTGRTKHTCGHDAHMTILLSLAKILMDNKDKIKGTIKLLFQPDEEGDGGANAMIQNGALENPKVDKAFAIHVWSELKEDTIGIKPGAVMASTDPFEILIHGKGGHAAMPEKCIDSIYIANVIGKKIKEMAVLDNEDLDKKVVLGITSISGGKNNNVIPDEVYLKGICRTFDNTIRKEIKENLEKTVTEVANQMGATAELKFIGNYPATVNSEIEAKQIQEIAKNIVENVNTNYRTMCSEDFSYFLEKVPGAMIFVGCQREKYYPQHNENFTVGINSILIGTQMFYEIAKKYVM